RNDTPRHVTISAARVTIRDLPTVEHKRERGYMLQPVDRRRPRESTSQLRIAFIRLNRRPTPAFTSVRAPSPAASTDLAFARSPSKGLRMANQACGPPIDGAGRAVTGLSGPIADRAGPPRRD